MRTKECCLPCQMDTKNMRCSSLSATSEKNREKGVAYVWNQTKLRSKITWSVNYNIPFGHGNSRGNPLGRATYRRPKTINPPKKRTGSKTSVLWYPGWRDVSLQMISKPLCPKHESLALEVTSKDNSVVLQRMLTMHLAAIKSRMENNIGLCSYIGKIHNCTLNSTVLTEENLHRTEIPLARCSLIKEHFP